MDTKQKILELLYRKDGAVSGQEIGDLLGLSRNSVWKAINQLKKMGYSIDASTNGYLLCDNDIFDSHSIGRYLKREHKLHIYKEESSSNDVAKLLCAQGEKEGGVVIVQRQTKGRGRMGRSFISSSENGLYMSLILRPSIRASECVNITVVGAVAVLLAIEECSGQDCQIKWVNDIYIREKKCCGILTEAALDFESGGVQYAVIGIGVNLCPPKEGFDQEIEKIACGVYENECPKGFKAKLCATIINKFFDLYERLEKKEYIELYRKKSNIIGKAVDVYVGDSVVTGYARDIDENANLIVADEDGNVHTFKSGEARVREQGQGLL